MPPKNYRHKVRNQNQSVNSNETTLEDYEKHLLLRIRGLEKVLEESRYEHRSQGNNLANELRLLSKRHQDLRSFQLSQ